MTMKPNAAGVRLIVEVVGKPVQVLNALDDLKQAIKETATEFDFTDMIELKEENL